MDAKEGNGCLDYIIKTSPRSYRSDPLLIEERVTRIAGRERSFWINFTEKVTCSAYVGTVLEFMIVFPKKRNLRSLVAQHLIFHVTKRLFLPLVGFDFFRIRNSQIFDYTQIFTNMVDCVPWRRRIAVYSTTLERWQGVKAFGSSNLPASAISR